MADQAQGRVAMTVANGVARRLGQVVEAVLTVVNRAVAKPGDHFGLVGKAGVAVKGQGFGQAGL